MRIEPSKQIPEPVVVVPPSRDAALPAGGKSLPPPPPPALDAVRKAAADIERFLREAGHELSFAVDHLTGRTVVTVRDTATGELIRQVPTEEALRIAHNLDLALPALIEDRA